LDLGAVAQRDVGVFGRAEGTAQHVAHRVVITFQRGVTVGAARVETLLRSGASGLLRGGSSLGRGTTGGQRGRGGLLLRGAVDDGAEVHRIGQLNGQVLHEHAGTERDVRVDVVGERR